MNKELKQYMEVIDINLSKCMREIRILKRQVSELSKNKREE